MMFSAKIFGIQCAKRIVHSVWIGLVAIGLHSLAAGAHANTLESIDFSALPGDQFEVHLKFSESPPTPEGYKTEAPARIVVDLIGVENGLTERNFPLSSVGNAQSATVVSAGDRTRLVLNLSSASNYNYRTEGNTIVIAVGAVGGANVAAQIQQSAAAQSSARQSQSPVVSNSSAKQITAIDFRRGGQGEGQVIVNLSTPNIGIDMREVSGAVEITFEGAQIPESLRRRLDVIDFATPVRFIDADNERLGGVIRVEADTSRNYDYLAYQADNEYVLSFKPLTQREVERKQQEFQFTGEKLNLTFTNIDINEVLGILADVAGFNLVTTDTVRGSITLRLTDVPWDQALDIVLKAKGLDKREVGNVMRIAPSAEIAEQERQELETLKQLQELAPLRTEYIRVRYADAGELFALFSSGTRGGSSSDGVSTGSILSERGHAIVDERTNSIILTDTADKITQFRELIDQIDIPTRQVLIEARIVIANSDFTREMGVRWGTDGTTTNNGGGHIHDYGTIVDLGTAPVTGAISYSFLSNNLLLDMELTALEDAGDGEVISQPKLVTQDKTTAIIQSGTQIPYQEASASGATSVSFVDAVLKLEVTPQITPDNNIILDIALNQDSVTDIAVSNVPVIAITQLDTRVLVKDGVTVVLGGILTFDEQNGERKVPFLGDIPYLGSMFKSKLRRENKQELLMFITPRILPDTLAQ